jgi:hypothetical protein
LSNFIVTVIERVRHRVLVKAIDAASAREAIQLEQWNLMSELYRESIGIQIESITCTPDASKAYDSKYPEV